MTPESPLTLARGYAELRYDIAQPELTVYEFDDASLLRFVAALKKQDAAAAKPIYQVWDNDKFAWFEVHPEYYAERLPSNRRILYTARPVAQPLAFGQWFAENCPEYQRKSYSAADMESNVRGMAYEAWQASPGQPVAQPLSDKQVEAFLAEVRAELIRARTKFPGDRIMTIALAEEFGELCKAVLDESAANVRKEAIQTAVMCARVVLDGDGSVNDWRAEKGLDPLVLRPSASASDAGGKDE